MLTEQNKAVLLKLSFYFLYVYSLFLSVSLPDLANKDVHKGVGCTGIASDQQSEGCGFEAFCITVLTGNRLG